MAEGYAVESRRPPVLGGPLDVALSRSGYSWLRTTIICLALLLEGMSSSSINVQVSAVRDALEPGRVELGLIASAFLLAYAGLLPVAGRLVDAWNRRTVFLLGVGLFGVGCLVCASAPAGWLLIAGRFVQGVGAALSAPAALALITADLPEGAHRNRAVALFGAMGAVGFSLGLVLPGFVVAQYGWRISFLVFVPVVLVVLAVTWTVRAAPPAERQPVDLLGSALLTGLLLVGMHTIGGIGSSPNWLLGVESVLVAALAVVLVRRGGVGGFPARVVRSPRVLACCVGLAAVFAGVLASMYIVSLGLQEQYGADAFAVGLAILPQPIAFSVLSGLGGRLVTRFGSNLVLGAGLLLTASALVYLGLAAFTLPPVAGMLPAMALVGAGLALCFPAASIGAVNAAPAEYRGTTAGLLTTWQNVGGATGLALVTALALVPEPGGDTGPVPGMYVSAAFILLGGLAALAIAVRSRVRVPTGRHR